MAAIPPFVAALSPIRSPREAKTYSQLQYLHLIWPKTVSNGPEFVMISVLTYISFTGKLPEFLKSLKCKKIVLIHGESFGAWCWYKTIALLEEAVLHPTSLDIKGSGINTTDSNHATTLAEFSQPLIDYLQNLEGYEKVVLVGHGVGVHAFLMLWSSIPKKLQMPFSFVQLWCLMARSLSMCLLKRLALGPAEHFMESKFLIHGNGKDKAPTGFTFERQLTRDLYFHQSPAKL
ncbi:hypothetical protein SAY86_020854 [Trapa natans]|uniref:AB hydrolase-1 domain-containing protein n=1 Tax=Trapa natans TaxID=22666 RepID=A0AAN7M8U3_TRANT|nr:hypothetical protein SAY86_020854 [Trapa natans]